MNTCNNCRYYLRHHAQCLLENFPGAYVKKGLIGECELFKPPLNYDDIKMLEESQSPFEVKDVE
jgi:hypothetical protein